MDTATIRTPLGMLQITADGTHIHTVEFKSIIKNQGPKTALLIRAVKELDEYFGGKRNRFTVPMRTKGTKFQESVWGVMREIGHGKTITYAELARAIKKPKAFRAVANACGKNPLPIMIPCHRVTASDGMGGYSGGVGKKKWLLAHEKMKSRL